MSDFSHITRPAPRWLHAWAIFTVIATAALLALGGIVTTFRVGMADPIWPTTPWYLLFISWREPDRGFLIEHTHRLAGYVVGCCVIVLAAGLWSGSPSRTLRRLGLTALAAVIAQGLLGGFRVRLNAWAGTDLAAVHGCFAQVVFSLLVSLAVLTGRRPEGAELPAEERQRLQRLSLLLTGLVFLQLVWGALVRHTHGAVGQRLHLLTAFAVVAVAVWLVQTVLGTPKARKRLGLAPAVLVGLLTMQIMLGVEAWMGKFGTGVLPEMQVVTPMQAVIRTGHVLVGTGILATAVVLALRSFRPAEAMTTRPEADPQTPIDFLPGPAAVAPLAVLGTRRLGETA